VAADSADVFAREHGPLTAADVVRIATQVASALDFATNVNAGHGTLHPRDLLVTADDVRMTGLGITQALERVGFVTPVRRPYTAPERIAGASWNTSADVFSLAAIVHELLWGRRIAATGDRAAVSLTPLDGWSLTALRRLFAHALAEDPDARFDSALKFVEGLDAAISSGAPAVTLADDYRPEGPAPEPSAARPAPGEIAGGPLADEGAGRPLVREIELKLPLALDVEDESADEIRAEPVDESPDLHMFPEPPIDVPIAAPVREPAAIDRPLPLAASPVLVFDRADRELDRPIVPLAMKEARLFEASGSALDRTRSAVWPLTLALAVGLMAGFGIGYAVASRPDAPGGAEVGSAPAPGDFESHGVPETEVLLQRTPAVPQTAPETTKLAARAALTPDSVVDGRVPSERPAAPRPEVPQRLVERPTPRAVPEPARPRTPLPPARPAARTSPVAEARNEPSATGVGSLNVDSRPPGANVLLDGRPVGTTPMTLSAVQSGAHRIAIELAGYRRWATSVHIAAAERKRVAASLER
jgi:hypothetical protein